MKPYELEDAAALRAARHPVGTGCAVAVAVVLTYIFLAGWVDQAGGDLWVARFRAALASTILGNGLIVGGAAGLWRWWRRPVILADPDPFQAHRGEDVVRHRVRIVNGGHGTLRSLRAALTIPNASAEDVVELGERADHELPFLDTKANFHRIEAERVTWVVESREEIDLHPGESCDIEILRWDYEPNHLVVPSERGYKKPRVCLRGDRSYELKLDLHADGVRGRRYDFSLVPGTKRSGPRLKWIDLKGDRRGSPVPVPAAVRGP